MFNFVYPTKAYISNKSKSNYFTLNVSKLSAPRKRAKWLALIKWINGYQKQSIYILPTRVSLKN